MKTIVQVLVICLVGATSVLAQKQVSSKSGVPDGNAGNMLDGMPRSLEVRFALSALPQSLREKAAVYVLDPAKGYVLDHPGTNGQNCFVDRTEWKWEEYRSDLYEPMCYDSAGAKSQMRVRFDTAELRANGIAPGALKKEIERRFAAGTYRAPNRAGFSYMAAPLMRTYMSLDSSDKTVMTMTMPHIMYYAPNVTDTDISGIPPLSPYPFVFEMGPLGYIVQRLGDGEAGKIVVDESALLKELCFYRSNLCLGTNDSGHPPSGHLN